MSKKRLSDLEQFNRNFSKKRLAKYSGKWIAFKGDKILANGKNIKKVIKEAEKKVQEPILIRITREDEAMIL